LSLGKPRHVAHGVLKVEPTAPLEVRLHSLHHQLAEKMAAFRPDCVAVEGVFTCRSARSALVLGHARGIALLAAAARALQVFEYSPARVKRSVGAGGAAQKDAVGRLVRRWLRIETDERADATDALAVAICHLHCAQPAYWGGKGLVTRSHKRTDAVAV